jgi:tetratricopeptide (TPR) repeat protein
MRALGILAIAVRILWLGSSSLLDDSSFLAKYFSVDRLLNRAALTSYSKDCEIAYSLQPSYESAKKIAKSYEMSGRFQDALSWYEKVQQFKPSDIDSLLFLGLMHHFSGEYASAMEYYNRILEQQADHADAWFHMGVSSQYTGDIQRAAFCYTKSVESDPMHMKSRLNLASMHHQYGSIDDALPHYQLALEQYKGTDLLTSPEYSMVKLNYGVALLQQGRHEEVWTDRLAITSTSEQLISHLTFVN